MEFLQETDQYHVHHLDIEDTPKGTISEQWLHIINNGLGEPVSIPIMVARGAYDGPILGLTAAIHGNELNGIPVIQRLFHELDVDRLHGTVVGVLVTNVPGLLLGQRQFNDGIDLNRISPGKPNGNVSELYINRVVERILKKFTYLIDLHTASFGRVNSWYIRANMTKTVTSRMARLQNPEIILHNPANDGTFRGTASSLDIRSITLELRDPHVFQFSVIEDALVGIRNVMYDFKMLEGSIVCPVKNTILCDRSYWIYTDEGGILEVFPKVMAKIKKGDKIAEVRTIFGKLVREYFAPEDGIVIGKSVNPVNQTGSRILHLGLHPTEIPCITEEDENGQLTNLPFNLVG
ncbi:MAG: succinylglutamate desuccinylase/aspartoacylase family protein [Saprospiraceae bacterium]|nr:succinylglutamate desuccinylase/aspartoacylase family protein [Saprospiraceae bacterium]